MKFKLFKWIKINELKTNKKLVVQIVVIVSLVCMNIGLLISTRVLNEDIARQETQIEQKSKQHKQQIKRLSDTWYAQNAQTTVTDFFNVYHTFSNSHSYNQRAKYAANYATKNITEDKGLFVSDYVNKINYIDSNQIQSKTMNVVFYPENNDENTMSGKVYVTVNAKRDESPAGTQIVVYHITYDKEKNKLIDVKTIGTEDIQFSSQVLVKNS